MRKTTNYGFNKPEVTDFYNVDDFNENMDAIDEELKKVADSSANSEVIIGEHLSTNNPHGITKTDVGLSNVPNVSTNNQTPTYTVPDEASELSSGEKLSVAFGKIAKFIKDGIAKFTSIDDEIDALNGSLEYHGKRLGYYIDPSKVSDLTTIDKGIYLFNGWANYTKHKPFDNAWGIWIKTADESLASIYEIVINFDTGAVYKSNNYEDFSSLSNLIKTKTITKTTDNNGCINVELSVANNAILSMTTNVVDTCCNIMRGTYQWFAQVCDLSGEPVTDTSVTVTVKYQ